MRLVVPHSEVITDEAGWTWLQPRPASTRVRHTLGTFGLAALIVAGGATWYLLPPPYPLPVTLLVATVGVWLLVGIAFGAGSRVALSDVGLYVQDGGSAAQLGWSAIAGVTAVSAGGRWRIRIDDGTRARTTRAAFDIAVARRWLALVLAEADRRRLDPVAMPDGAGFTGRSPAPRPPS